MDQGLTRTALSMLAGALALTLALPAQAEKIYRYTDDDGVTVLSNVAPGASRKSLKMREKGGVVAVTAPALVQPARREVRDYDGHLEEACQLYRIPVPLARAVIAAESNFNPKAVSHKGALGLMQLMPQTAAEMFVADAFEPKQNIHGGVRYLRVLANMFDGDMVRIVAAYNAGPEAVKRAGGVPNIAETQDYVRKVLRLYFAFKGEAEPGT